MAALVASCGQKKEAAPEFKYTVDEFADLKIMRYRVPGWNDLTFNQKAYAYYLAEAGLGATFTRASAPFYTGSEGKLCFYKIGDELTIRFGNRLGRYEITDVSEVVRKENAAQMYRVLEEDDATRAERE